MSDEPYTAPDGREIAISKVHDYPFPGETMYRAAFKDMPNGPAHLGTTPVEALGELIMFDEWASWYMFARTLP